MCVYVCEIFNRILRRRTTTPLSSGGLLSLYCSCGLLFSDIVETPPHTTRRHFCHEIHRPKRRKTNLSQLPQSTLEGCEGPLDGFIYRNRRENGRKRVRVSVTRRQKTYTVRGGHDGTVELGR